jgi:hypothetical protein
MAARITIGVVLSAFALSLLLSLTGCDSDSAVAVVADGTGTDSLDSEVIVTTDAVGSVGDGPIVNARVRVFSNTDRLLMETRSSNTADYQLSIKTAGHNYPLTIIADQGTDLVTNAPPDFRLVSTIMKPGNRQVANLNPYSTLIVESAKRAGGINDATIAAATEAVVQRYGFGLDPGLGIDPMFDPMDDSNVHVIVKASETLGEMIRRTRDAVITSGTLVTGDGVVEALAADLIDGWIDGEGARGHDPRIAAVANVASAAVMVEAMANRLHVYKVNATQAMDDAIEHVRPNAKGRTRDVGIPADALVQSKRALRAAGRVVGDERVSQTIAVMDGTEPGTTEIFGLPTGIEYVLNDAILTAAYVYDDFTLDGINTVAKDGSSLDSDPNSGDHSEPTDEADSDNNYSVSASAGAGGSISPASQTVTHGNSTSFSVSPNSGYSIASVSGCGGSLSGSTYTTGPITQACAVSASFSANQYSVSASAGSGGSISPSSQTVTHGASTSFSVSPSSGYSIASVTGCGGSLSGSSYTTGPITQACAVSASFDPEPLQEEPNTVLWSLNEWNWFDGVNEQRTTGLTLSQLAGGSFTIEAIVQYAGTASRTWTPIIGASHGPSYLHSESFFIGKNSGSNALRVDIGGFGYINIDSRGLFDGQEHHLALVYDRQAQQIRIYVDQSLIHTQTGVSGTLSTSSQMLIGAVGHTTAERWLGWIGPTRLTGGALSPTQFLGTEGSEPIAPRPNRTPTIAGTPTTNLVVGNFWSFTPTAADPDGDSLTFTIQGEPAWASFDPSTGQISGTPSAAGSFGPITITVSDGKQSVSLAAFTLQVVEHATGTASLSWTIPTERADGTFLDDLAGYRLYYGKDANSLTHVIQIADVGRTNQLIENLDNGTWYFAVTAYCRKGLESAKSNIGSKTIR